MLAIDTGRGNLSIDLGTALRKYGYAALPLSLIPNVNFTFAVLFIKNNVNFKLSAEITKTTV